MLLAVLFVASGSYGTSILSTSFKYVGRETSRKSFVDGDQAHDYYARYDMQVKRAYTKLRPKAERALAAAKKEGTPLLPYDVLLPAIAIDPKDVQKVKKSVYPLNLVFDASSSENFIERFELTFKAPPSVEQAKVLVATLKRIAGHHWDEHDDIDEALLKTFTKPVAAVHVDELFAVYVGTTAEVQDVEAAKKRFFAVLARILPGLKKRFSEEAERFKVPLKPMQPAIDGQKRELVQLFNPWGPLLSGDFVRMSRDIGSADVIVMIAPDGKIVWDELHPVLSGILTGEVHDAHNAAILAEGERLNPDER